MAKSLNLSSIDINAVERKLSKLSSSGARKVAENGTKPKPPKKTAKKK